MKKEKTETLIKSLNALLANFQVYYQNLRGLHWNIRGKLFFELHIKFEEYYLDAQVKADLTAERILALGGTPLHTFIDYYEKSAIEVGENITKDEEAVRLIVNSLGEILKQERIILKDSAGVNDEGTNNMMSDFIAEQKKTMWMLNAWLN